MRSRGWDPPGSWPALRELRTAAQPHARLALGAPEGEQGRMQHV